MEHQLMINGDTGTRLNAQDHFTFIKKDWRTWKTSKGVERAKERVALNVREINDDGSFHNPELTIISFPDDNDMIKANIETYREGLARIETYLNLAKFNCPNDYVNVADVVLRINEIKNELLS